MRRAIAGGICVIGVGALLIPFIEPRFAANIAMICISIFAWAFVMLYGLGSAWHQTRAGRAILYLTAGLAVFATQVSISAWLSSDYYLRNEIRFIAYWSLAVVILNVIRILIYEQRGRPRCNLKFRNKNLCEKTKKEDEK